MALARTGTRTGTSTRSDIVSLGTEISTNVDAGRLSRVPSASTTAMAAFGSPRPSVYPSIPPTASTPAAASPAPNNKTLVSDTNEPVSSFSSLTAVNRGDEDVSVELEETRVSFDPQLLQQQQQQQQHSNTPGSATSSASSRAKPTVSSSSPSLCKKLVSHPLRSSDQTSTLHCIYTVIARNTAAPWIAVCWCDERGEYVEHQVFAEQKDTGIDEISASSAGRIWAGCLRYQALFGGQLRVVLGEWHGLSQKQADSWHSYICSLDEQKEQAPFNVQLILVNIGFNPTQGLSVVILSTDGQPALA
ncbi:hypothetical protein FB639_005161 [Coemansia asiatica]|nr:hypothetical protein FB639_005161 [Coemansia asiatica]